MKNNNKQSGFSLIEVLVAVAIFGTFIALASTSLVNVLKQEQKTNVLRVTEESTRYILESISREARSANGEFDLNNIRVAHAFLQDGDKLVLLNTDLSEQDLSKRMVTKTEYYLEEGVFKKSIYEKKVGEIFPDISKEATSLNKLNDLKITEFRFNISSDTDLEKVPLINELVLKGESGKGKDFVRDEYRANVELKTAVVSRGY